MQLDKTKIFEIADQYGFNRNFVEKQYRLIDILDSINNEPFLCDKLALKGGTNINLFTLEGPRLSIDIDLDYSKSCNRQDMEKDRKIITNKLEELVLAKGYKINDNSKHYHALDSIQLDYTNFMGNPEHIKVETNYICREHILEPIVKETCAPWLTDKIKSLCVNPIEVFASKITALSTRGMPRDLYDVYNLSKEINENDLELLHKCVVFYAAVGSDDAEETLSSEIDEITPYRIRTELLPVLSKKDTFNLDEAKEEVEEFLSAVRELDASDEAFLEQFNEGTYEPDLLFEDEEILERIDSHPMALWKCENNRERGL